jgi:hypothetical protein
MGPCDPNKIFFCSAVWTCSCSSRVWPNFQKGSLVCSLLWFTILLWQGRWIGYGLDDRGSISGKEQVMDFFLRHSVQSGFAAHPASYQMGTGILSPGVESRDVKLTTRLHLVPRLRMRGAISPLSHPSSLRGTWLNTGTILPLPKGFRFLKFI